jgi:hypothetical protein
MMPLEAGHPEDVEPRSQGLDQLQFAQQRGELVAGLLPDEYPGVPDDLAGLGVAAVLAEVREEASTEVLRLADVHDAAAVVDHPVDTRAARGVVADALEQPSRPPAAQPLAGGRLALRPEPGRAEPVEHVGGEEPGVGAPVRG